MGRNSKRKKRDDSSSESSPSNSISSMIQTQTENKQLDEISSKLSLILKAIQDLSISVKETNQGNSPTRTEAAITELPSVFRLIEEEVKRQTTSNNISNRIPAERMKEGVSPFEAEAMRVKSCIGQLWENKLKARKDAYWGYVKNSGNLRFHEKWMSANPRIVIPRKLQKFEMKYKNDQQKALRERSVLQDFKNEIEMEKLKTDACIERYRKIDAEIEEIILSKCSGPVADLLFEQWRMNVQKNEYILHKRWSNNDKWLKSYEAEFLKTYEHSNPFFKEGN